jgi:hypothetical protein
MTCGNINADELAEVIRRLSHDDPSLVDLTMSWSNLGDSGCEKLSDSIRFNNYLVDLDIYSNNITSAGLVRMGTALSYEFVLLVCQQNLIVLCTRHLFSAQTALTLCHMFAWYIRSL